MSLSGKSDLLSGLHQFFLSFQAQLKLHHFILGDLFLWLVWIPPSISELTFFFVWTHFDHFLKNLIAQFFVFPAEQWVPGKQDLCSFMGPASALLGVQKGDWTPRPWALGVREKDSPCANCPSAAPCQDQSFWGKQPKGSIPSPPDHKYLAWTLTN